MEYLKIIKSRWRFICITTLICLLMSFIYSFFISSIKYEAEVKVFVGKEKFKKISEEIIDEENYTSDEVSMYQNLIKTHSELISSKDLLNSAIDKNSYNLELQQIKSNLKVEPIADTQILKIRYKSESAQESYNMLYEITKSYIEMIAELYPKINISVVQQVDVGTSSLFNKVILNGVIGAGIGIVGAIGIIILLQITNNTFRNKEELEKYINLNVIGVIPKTEE